MWGHAAAARQAGQLQKRSSIAHLTPVNRPGKLLAIDTREETHLWEGWGGADEEEVTDGW